MQQSLGKILLIKLNNKDYFVPLTDML